jgi:hypothetical protein
MYIYITGIHFVSVPMIFLLYFWTVLKVWYFLFHIFLLLGQVTITFSHTEFPHYLFIGYVEIKAIVEVYTGRNEPHMTGHGCFEVYTGRNEPHMTGYGCFGLDCVCSYTKLQFLTLPHITKYQISSIYLI